MMKRRSYPEADGLSTSQRVLIAMNARNGGLSEIIEKHDC
jgi:hypothetical protein